MKIIYVVLAIGYLFLAVAYPVTNTLPPMYVVVLMCLTLSICFFNDYLREKYKDVQVKYK